MVSVFWKNTISLTTSALLNTVETMQAVQVHYWLQVKQMANQQSHPETGLSNLTVNMRREIFTYMKKPIYIPYPNTLFLGIIHSTQIEALKMPVVPAVSLPN
jgi:hypothetical protein